MNVTRVRLESSRVRLVPVGPAERAALFAVVTDPRVAFRWRSIGPGTSPRIFERLLEENVLCQFAIQSKSSGDLIGMVQCVAANFHHGTAQLTVLIAPSYWGKGWPLEGVLLFLSYVFVGYPLRKLYLEIPEQNWHVLRRGASRLFREEGVLSKREWHLGAWRDVALYSVDRDEFFEHPLTARVRPEWWCSGGHKGYIARESVGA